MLALTRHDPLAMAILAIEYPLEADGRSDKYGTQCLEWLQALHKRAHFWLGEFLYRGIGVKADAESAVNYLIFAGSEGCAHAYFSLGCHFDCLAGFPKIPIKPSHTFHWPLKRGIVLHRVF